MKNCIYLFLLSCLFIVTSCDTNGEDVYSGYISFSTSFIYPTDAYDSYEVFFNGNVVPKSGVASVDKNNPEGTLEIYKKGSDIPEFSKKITISSGEIIRLIKLDGHSIDIYDENSYDSFTLNVIFQAEKEPLYKVFFNGNQITNGMNFLKKEDEHGGILKIYKEGEQVAVFNQDVVIAANGIVNIMQLAESEFLLIPENSEPAPESKQYTKLRFFYTSDALPGVERIRIIIYEWTNFTELGSVEIKAGQLSSYQTIDWDVVGSGGGLCQDIIDLTDGEPGVKIVDSAINTDAYISVDRGTYKFATTRLGTGGVFIGPVAALCTPW